MCVRVQQTLSSRDCNTKQRDDLNSAAAVIAGTTTTFLTDIVS